MTSPPPRITVWALADPGPGTGHAAGRRRSGRERTVTKFTVAHGDDPALRLARLGLVGTELLFVRGNRWPHTLELGLRVRPGPVLVGPPPPVPRDAGIPESAVGVRHQRVSTHAVVRSGRGLLVTQLSERTSRPSCWTLPGGGLDAGELPDKALLREIAEETGQRPSRWRPRLLDTRHWIGRAPSGRLEDYHAVGVIYEAWCDEPSDPVVREREGTTQAAAWVAPDALGGLRLTAYAARIFTACGAL